MRRLHDASLRRALRRRSLHHTPSFQPALVAQLGSPSRVNFTASPKPACRACSRCLAGDWHRAANTHLLITPTHLITPSGTETQICKNHSLSGCLTWLQCFLGHHRPSWTKLYMPPLPCMQAAPQRSSSPNGSSRAGQRGEDYVPRGLCPTRQGYRRGPRTEPDTGAACLARILAAPAWRHTRPPLQLPLPRPFRHCLAATGHSRLGQLTVTDCCSLERQGRH